MRRALAIALLVVLALRVGPVLLAWLSPRFAARARAVQRRLDVVGALAMIGWVVVLVVGHAYLEAAVVGVFALPVIAGGVAALRAR